MTDVVDRETRSRMMAGIRGKDTKPELTIRKAIHARGFRYRIHDRRLPGKPDMVFPRYRAVILVNGCFWHGHNCHLFKWPSTRVDFWKTKIERNREKDGETMQAFMQPAGVSCACGNARSRAGHVRTRLKSSKKSAPGSLLACLTGRSRASRRSQSDRIRSCSRAFFHSISPG